LAFDPAVKPGVPMNAPLAARSRPTRCAMEVVRPVQVWDLGLFYLLMLLMVAPGAWGALLGTRKADFGLVSSCFWGTISNSSIGGLSSEQVSIIREGDGGMR